jgi:prevent-host-death family protein
MRVSVAQLKARLSEYVARARSGEEVVVTDRGRPVAMLTQVRGEYAAESRMADLVRRGLVRPALKPLPADFWDMPRGEDPGGWVLKALLEEREEGY